MAGSTFKTMYLVSKSDLENRNRNDDNVKKNFKLSLQNRDICDGGMSVSVKPIKTRVQNKRTAEKTTNVQLDVSDSEDGDEQIPAPPEKKTQQYARFKAQSTESNPKTKRQHSSSGFRSGYHFKYPNDDADDDNDNNGDKTNGIDFENSNPLNMVEYNGSDFRNNGDNSAPSNMSDYNNNGHKDNEADPTLNDEDGSIPSNMDKYKYNDKSETIGQRPKKVKYGEKMKNYKFKKLQKRHSKILKKKFLDNERSKNISYQEELPLNQIGNHSISQDENGDTLEDEHSQKRYINEELKTDEVDENQISQSVSNLKKRKILDDVQKMKDDQWLGRIKSRLNDKRVQFKRKRDTIGYRINPDDISKSLIKPSDFTYLNQTESADYLDKWKSLKELRKKPFRNKRFKPYR